MRTMKDLIEASAVPAPLVRAVVKQLGGWKEAKKSLRDIAAHGIDGGFPNFIHYTDTVAFYRKHRNAINEYVKVAASEFGQHPDEFVTDLNCLKNVDRGAIPDMLYGSRFDWENIGHVQVANALTWFIAEEVAQAFGA